MIIVPPPQVARNVASSQPELVVYEPSSADEVSRFRTNVGRNRGRVWFGRVQANVGRFRISLGRFRVNVSRFPGQIWPMSDTRLAKIGPFVTDFGPILADSGQTVAEFGPDSSVEIGPNLLGSGQN